MGVAVAGCRSGETRARGRVLVSERAGDGSPSFSFVQRLRELERSEALYTFLQLSLSPLSPLGAQGDVYGHFNLR